MDDGPNPGPLGVTAHSEGHRRQLPEGRTVTGSQEKAGREDAPQSVCLSWLRGFPAPRPVLSCPGIRHRPDSLTTPRSVHVRTDGISIHSSHRLVAEPRDKANTLVDVWTSAPLSRSEVTMSACPSWEARCSGVTPCLVTTLVSAP